MSDSNPTTVKSKRDPTALSGEYHKAHKQLMLWSTILLIWELIGVDLSKAKDAGGNIGPIVTALKSPQAVPWALAGLVVYFLFKCSVEWAQCHVDRRKIRFARVDFISAWIVALAALALYVGQALSRAQLANTIQGSTVFDSILGGAMLGFLLISGAQAFWSYKTRHKWSQHALGFFIMGLAGFSTVGFLIWKARPIIWRYFLLGLGTTSIIGLFAGLMSKIVERKDAVVLPKK
jgi:hypothetical protein